MHDSLIPTTRWSRLFFEQLDTPLADLPPPPRLPEPQARGIAPFGYEKVWPGRYPRFEVVEEEAEVVRRLYARLAEPGASPYAVWKGMKAKGKLPTRTGEPMTFESFQKIATNLFYLGLKPWHGEVYAGTHEPLVDEATWKAAFRSTLRRRSQVAEKWEERRSTRLIQLHEAKARPALSIYQ